MTENKFTRDEWFVYTNNFGEKIIAISANDSNDENLRLKIADVWGVGFHRLEVEVNAHLIAAAPNLLEACEHLLKQLEIEDNCGEPVQICWNSNLQEKMEMMRKAIAKSKGE